jgi:hypothetical protein
MVEIEIARRIRRGKTMLIAGIMQNFRCGQAEREKGNGDTT